MPKRDPEMVQLVCAFMSANEGRRSEYGQMVWDLTRDPDVAAEVILAFTVAFHCALVAVTPSHMTPEQILQRMVTQ